VFQRRLRVFAGPNGSGKSSLLEQIPKSVPLGYYINADEIEKQIVSGRAIRLSDFGISPDLNDLIRFLKKSDYARYYRSLELLYSALGVCYKSYLFDNSYNTIEIARIDRDGIMYPSVQANQIPNWMIKYVISKYRERYK
jgi:predicted ABC-type ATPase